VTVQIAVEEEFFRTVWWVLAVDPDQREAVEGIVEYMEPADLTTPDHQMALAAVKHVLRDGDLPSLFTISDRLALGAPSHKTERVDRVLLGLFHRPPVHVTPLRHLARWLRNQQCRRLAEEWTLKAQAALAAGRHQEAIPAAQQALAASERIKDAPGYPIPEALLKELEVTP